jgi:hypothetical protein
MTFNSGEDGAKNLSSCFRYTGSREEKHNDAERPSRFGHRLAARRRFLSKNIRDIRVLFSSNYTRSSPAPATGVQTNAPKGSSRG